MNRSPSTVANAAHLAALLAALHCWQSDLARAVPIPISPSTENPGEWIITEDIPLASSGMTLELRRFAQFPNNPNGSPARLNKMSYAPGIDAIFVVNAGQQWSPASPGIVYQVNRETGSATPILDVSEVYTLPRDKFALDHQGGLRSVAFHPDFSSPGSPGFGKLYTSKTATRTTSAEELTFLGPANPTLGPLPNTSRHDGVVTEWTAIFDDSGNLAGVDTTSAREVYRVATPDLQHPIKEAAFNLHARPGDEDYGLLYVLHPDGAQPFRGVTAGSGQRAEDVLGKIVRINPLADGDLSYTVPQSNPFVQNGLFLPEVYAVGFRDHHTISFSKSSEMFVSDIGADYVEEINQILPGGNYGWSLYEGTFSYENPGISQLPNDGSANDFIFPSIQYAHQQALGTHAVAGGYPIENGSSLHGKLVFGDFASPTAKLMLVDMEALRDATITGDIANLAPATIATAEIVFDHDDDPLTPSVKKFSLRDLLDDEAAYDGSGRTDIRFGQGPGGEIYLLNKRNGWMYLFADTVVDESTLANVDVNEDGFVNGLDLLIWQRNFGLTSEATPALGDANSDGMIDSLDFYPWEVEFGRGGPAATSVPEPSSLAWLALAATSCFRLRARTPQLA